MFLQDGSDDLNNNQGNWFLANQQMLSAMEWSNANPTMNGRTDTGARYDVRYEWGDGAHSDAHGGALLPDILRWMWR